jgi:hypothetical protein
MLQYAVLASVAEWSIAADCKSAGFMPTLVQIQPGAQQKIPKGDFFV